MGRRADFDPLRSYEAARQFVWKGEVVCEGAAFTDRGDMRRLRQLYDSRFLRMTEDDSRAPAFASMSVEQLRQWLIDHGEPNLAHPRAPQVRLLERCRRLWLKEAQPHGITTGHTDSAGSGEGLSEATAARSHPEGSRVERERIR